MQNNKTIWHILIMFALLFAISCQQDTFEEEITQEELEIESSELSPSFTVEYKTREDFENNTFLTKHVNEINQVRNINSNNTETFGIVNSVDYGFSINTDRYQHISNEYLDSYSFNVIRDTPVEDVLENYILTQYSDGHYKQWLITYPIDNNFESGYDIANASLIEVTDPDLILFSTSNDFECEATIAYNPDTCSELPCSTGNHTLDNASSCPIQDPMLRPRLSCENDFGYSIIITCSGGGVDGTGDNPPPPPPDDGGNPGDSSNTGDDPGPGGSGTGSGNTGGDSDNNEPTCTTNDIKGETTCPTPVIPFSPPTLITLLGITDQAQIDYLSDINNTTIVREIFDFYVGQGQTDEARDFAIWNIDFRILAQIPCGTVNNDCVQSIRDMAEGLRRWHGVEGALVAEYLENLIADFSSFTLSDLQTFYDTAVSITEQYNALTRKMITGAFVDGITPILDIALFELGGTVAIKLLQRIPLSWVLRGARLNRVILRTTQLGEAGFSNARLISNSSYAKAEALFTKLTKDAVSVAPAANNPSVIVAQMGDGLKIVLRPNSTTVSNAVAVIEYQNFTTLLGTNSFTLKFLP